MINRYVGIPYPWLLLGLFSQICFCMRWVVQWVISEKKSKSVIPYFYWYLSITGAIGLLIYSIYRKDPIFIIGQALGIIIYSRNLFF